MTEQQQYPTREQVVRLLTLLADGRAEYFHGKEPEHQGHLRAMRFDELIIYAEREAARHIRDIVAGDNVGRGWMPSWRWDDLAAMLALFPQPTPSEVEVEGSFFAVADLPEILARHMRALDDANRREKQHWIEQHEQPMIPEQRRERMCPCTLEPVLPSAEPVSIADMAPGTTFTAVDPGRLGDRATFEVLNDHRVRNIESWVHWHPASFIPSTIRDVTPPPTTLEAEQ